AFGRAWMAVCSTTGWPTLLVPPGKTFLLSEVSFPGPCPYEITHLQVEGNIVAPDKLWTSQISTSWISFTNITALVVDGNGQIDGRGPVWWDCKKKNKCDNVPSLLGISGCVDFEMRGMKLLNSPGEHLIVDRSKWVRLKGLNFTSPADSPYTDGIYIVGSHYVEVTGTTIGTGGDCITIGAGSSDVNITGITCSSGRGK
uniref:Exopolygalacturonase-like n=1 Tax=Elaeis guineensis var. tenera TaxID=51953 RepID=A0A6I9QKS2_ELAGV